MIGGVSSVFVDLQVAMDHDYAIVFPVAAVLILLILGLLLQSLVAPWYLMAAVGLGFAATLGAAVAVFQDFGGSSGLIFILPIVMYLFVVALGTDYNILMISRLREEAQEGLNPHDAAAMAVSATPGPPSRRLASSWPGRREATTLGRASYEGRSNSRRMCSMRRKHDCFYGRSEREPQRTRPSTRSAI